MHEWLKPNEYPSLPAADVQRANRLIDWLLSGAVYAADYDGLPADETQRAACVAAARAQADWVADGGDLDGRAWSIGSVSAGADGSSSGRVVGPEAARILQSAGLMWQVT